MSRKKHKIIDKFWAKYVQKVLLIEDTWYQIWHFLAKNFHLLRNFYLGIPWFDVRLLPSCSIFSLRRRCVYLSTGMCSANLVPVGSQWLFRIQFRWSRVALLLNRCDNQSLVCVFLQELKFNVDLIWAAWQARDLTSHTRLIFFYRFYPH